MKHTTNYNLNKIELTDSPPDITALNPNFDTIDTQLKARADKDTELNTAINQVKTDYLPKTGGNVTNGLTVKNKTVAVSVNGSTADANGNITIDVGGKVQSVNGVTPDANGNVAIEFGGGDVQSVDGVEPDEDGNVQLNALTQAEILEAVQRVTDVEVDPSVAEVQALQTAVARVESNLDSKMDGNKIHIVETWKNGTNWYRKWSDGWIEQGGYCSTFTSGTHTLNLNIAFSNTAYYFARSSQSSVLDSTLSANMRDSGYHSKTTSTVSMYWNTDMTNSRKGFDWYACGF